MKFRFVVSFLLCSVLLTPVVRADEFSSLQQQILSLIQQVTRLQSDLTNLQRISQFACVTLNRNLQLGDSGDDVLFLQTSLGKEGFDVGGEKAKKEFGELTASAVSGFQQKYSAQILTPLGLKYGTGFVGSGTRAKINSMYGCAAKAPDLSPGQIQPVRALQHLTILNPSGGQTLSNPLSISGYVNSNGWIGNNAGTAKLLDTTGLLLGQTPLQPKTDVRHKPVAFEGKISFRIPRVDTGVLVLTSQNTTTFLSAAEKEVRLPVKFSLANRSIVVKAPQAGEQLVGGEMFTVQWTSTSTGAVSLYLINTTLEALGSDRALSWKAENIPNTRFYRGTLPTGISGNYRVHVNDGSSFGTSPIFYIFDRSQIAGKPPVITEVTGPTSLKINQKGSWQVRASDPDKDALSFSVAWGDGSVSAPSISSQTDTGGWFASFENHSYPLKYDYPVTFIVTDSKGLSFQKVLTVKVTP